MKCEFVVGQKVVCVNDGLWQSVNGYFFSGAPLPVKDGVYAVTAIEEWFGRIYLRLAEVPTTQCFEHVCFRPVQERKTDISVFTALLNPANHKQMEGV